MFNKKKIYKYKTSNYSIDLISQEWFTAKTYLLNKENHRIEVEKIKEVFLGTPIIYYYYVKEQEQ
jgi:hypothetical protein